jgi:predicted transcriptional regulator
MVEAPACPPAQPHRHVAITAHLPREIRDRLKILAARQRRTMNDMTAEALEDLFLKHAEEDR